jgi:hypothetical protein
MAGALVELTQRDVPVDFGKRKDDAEDWHLDGAIEASITLGASGHAPSLRVHTHTRAASCAQIR